MRFPSVLVGLVALIGLLRPVSAVANIRVLHSIRDSSSLAKRIDVRAQRWLAPEDSSVYHSRKHRLQVFVAGSKLITNQVYSTVAPDQTAVRYLGVPPGSQLFEVYITGTSTQMMCASLRRLDLWRQLTRCSNVTFAFADGEFYTITLGRSGSDSGPIRADMWLEECVPAFADTETVTLLTKSSLRNCCVVYNCR